MVAVRKALVVVVVFTCALLLAPLLSPATATAAPSPWSDLPSSVLATYGLTQDEIGGMSNGYPDGNWRPDEYVTRAQFVRFAMSYFGILPDNPGFVYQHFSDVPQDSPYYGWVEAAFEVGLVNGYKAPSGTELPEFGLYEPVTREQAVAILTRYLSKVDPSTFDFSAYTEQRVQELLAPFADADQVRHRQEVAMAIDVKVLRPSGTALRPQAGLTRIQAAALIARTKSLAPVVPPPPATDSHILWWLFNDAYAAGIEVDGSALGSLAPWTPRTLWLRGRAEAGQDPAAYAAIGQKLVSVAETYQDRMAYEEVRILLLIPGGEVVYDHTCAPTPST